MTSPAPKTRQQRPDGEDLLLPKEAAAFLRVPLATLNGWRHRRRVDGTLPGPQFIRLEGDRVRYRRADLWDYVAERTGARRATRG